MTVVETSGLPETQRHIPHLYLLRMSFSNPTHGLFQVAFFTAMLALSNANTPSRIR
jgi:hypothetical protein